MAPRPSTALDQVRARVRRAQLIIGLGFISHVLGLVLSASLIARLAPRFQTITSEAVFLVANRLLVDMWILAVLPLVCYGVARVIPLKPVTTAVGAGLTGELLAFVIGGLSGGMESLWAVPADFVLRLVTGVAGVLITMWAVKSALAQNAAVEADAKQAAEAKKNEYEEFAKESERLAAQREKPADAPQSSSAAESTATTTPSPPGPSDPGNGVAS